MSFSDLQNGDIFIHLMTANILLLLDKGILVNDSYYVGVKCLKIDGSITKSVISVLSQVSLINERNS